MNRLTNLAEFNLSLDVDFTPLFHWNTKQLFVYLALEYENANMVSILIPSLPTTLLGP